MCTVTYIPGKGGFHLTSNRDEHITRGQAIAPQAYPSGANTLLYPKDADKNGSWISAKSNGDLVVLLNGAFVKHTRQPGYKQSRGVVLINIIKADNPYQFYLAAHLGGIEPFTIVLYAAGNLYECRWDGERKHVSTLNTANAYIWSSATLYDKVAETKRINWFGEWQRSVSSATTNDIIDFHKHGGEGDLQDGLVIDRDGKMKTMSITSIRVTPAAMTMTYNDLKNNNRYVNELPVQTEANTSITLPRFYALRCFFIRLFNWEYWSFNTVYAPIMFYWFWLSLKSRSFFFFNTANPLIENGGFAMESKWLIHKQLPKDCNPQTLFFKSGTRIDEILNAVDKEKLVFPMIAKPDIGGRGVLVKKIHDEQELADYTKQFRVDFLLQEYIPYKNEVGIFYYRIPGEEKGRISGIVGKEFFNRYRRWQADYCRIVSKRTTFFITVKNACRHAHRAVSNSFTEWRATGFSTLREPCAGCQIYRS